MKKLAPCPFCGGEPSLVRIRRYPVWNTPVLKKMDTWTVICENLDCILYDGNYMYYSSPEYAANAWNRRSAPVPEAEGNTDPVPKPEENPDSLPPKLRPWQRTIQEDPFAPLTL